MVKSMSFKTYAKINLSLDVTGIRENGYHEVAMIMHGINLFDDMSVKLLPSDKSLISIKTDKFYVPCDERNTAWKAAKLIIDEFSPAPCEIRIDMKKTIPVAAGLAGGSSNAAGVLLALNSLMKLGMNIDELCRLAAKIGADVPFSLQIMSAMNPMFNIEGGTVSALAEGIGELLSPLPSVKFWTVLAKPRAGMSTVEVYKALDALSGYEHPDTKEVIAGVRENDLRRISSAMKNVLENVTLVKLPEAKELKNKMEKLAAGKNPVMMSGSGPTIYALFEDKESAEGYASELRNLVKGEKTEVFCVETL